MADQSVHKLEASLKGFYDNHNVDLSDLLSSSTRSDGAKNLRPYRFIRLNPRHDREETLRMLKDECNQNTQPVLWLDEAWGFYALPSDCSMANSKCFQSGRIYGMDVSSGAGVAALLSTLYDKTPPTSKSKEPTSPRVLDLCCCPGLKLCAMADFLQDSSATLVGVDVSEHRMALCKKIVHKYHVDKVTSGNKSKTTIQLYCQDGTKFGSSPSDDNLVFDSRVALEEEEARGKRKRMNKSARARERKRLKQFASSEWVATGDPKESPENASDPSTQMKPFDYVLVDAECSTDGSLKHMKERLKEPSSSKEEANPMLTDKKKLTELVDLQRKLLLSGFTRLKEGGTLVYSTCSLSQEQNEKVVQWLLQRADAFVIPVHFSLAKSKLVSEGSLEGTVRFAPNLGMEGGMYGDGFFLAKIGKRRREEATAVSSGK